MNNALFALSLHLGQGRYILRVVITQTIGYEVNLTSFGLTPGLDC